MAEPIHSGSGERAVKRAAPWNADERFNAGNSLGLNYQQTIFILFYFSSSIDMNSGTKSLPERITATVAKENTGASRIILITGVTSGLGMHHASFK